MPRRDPLGPSETPRGRADPEFPVGWAELEREIAECRRCPLHRSRTHVVTYRGSPRPAVLFVGEAPGAVEDRLGVPFAGRSGKRLDRAIDEIGLGPSEYGILNLIKCRPPGNRFPIPSERACRPFLDRQIALLGPRGIVTLGARALAALDPGAPAVLTAAGTLRSVGGRPLFPLLHPAAPLHAPRWRERWARDLEALRRALPKMLRPRRGPGPRRARSDHRAVPARNGVASPGAL